MATESSPPLSLSFLGPSAFPVFVDTSLDTHLAMALYRLDTVGGLKSKIAIEHALCFPDMGEITIHAIKVKRKASFYHLSDSMPVISAFKGVSGTWFLHVDAVLTTVPKSEAGDTKNVNEKGELLERHYEPHMEPAAGVSLGFSADKMQGSVLNGPPDGKNLQINNIANVHEQQAVPEALLNRLSENGLSALPTDGSHENESLLGSSKDMLATVDCRVDTTEPMNLVDEPVHDGIGTASSKVEKRLAFNASEEREQDHIANEAVGSDIQPKADIVNDGGSEGGREEDRGNAGVGANGGHASILIIKKEKSRKRSKLPVNDVLLDRNAEYVVVEKKRRKKRKDVSFVDPEAGNHSSFVTSQETSKLEDPPTELSSQEKRKRDLASAEGTSRKLTDDSSLAQNFPDEKKKKKKKKKRQSLKFHDEADPTIPSTDNNVKVSHNKEGSYAKTEIHDNSMDGPNVALSFGKQVTDKFPEKKLVNKQKDPGKESDAGSSIDKAAWDVADGGLAEVGTANLSSTRHNGIGCNRENFFKSKQVSHSPSEVQALEEQSEPSTEDQLSDIHTELNKDSNPAVPLRNPAVDSEVPTSSFHMRKKSKNELSKDISCNHDSVLSSGEHANKGGTKERDSHRDLNKEGNAADVLDDSAYPEKPTRLDSEVPSNANAESSCPRRRKKRDKTELSNLHSDKNVNLHSSEDQATEPKNNKTSLSYHHGYPGKESGEAFVTEEALENHLVWDSAVALKAEERKSRRKRKSSSKELQSHEFMQHESAHHHGSNGAKENPQGTLENSDKDLGGESKSINNGETAGLGIPAKVELVNPSNNNGENSRHHKKRSAKTELPHDKSSKRDLSLSLENRMTREDFEKTFGTTHRDSVNESNAEMLLATTQSTSHGNGSTDLSPKLFSDSTRKHETAHHPTILVTQENTKEFLGNSRENTGNKSSQNVTHKKTAESVEENEKNDASSDHGKVNLIDCSLAQVVQPESVVPAQEAPSIETETGKSWKGETNGKSKSGMPPQDTTGGLVISSSSNKHHVLDRKPQETEPSIHGFVDSRMQPSSKTRKTRKAHDKKIVGRTSKPSMHLGDTSSHLMPSRSSHDDVRPEKKLEDSISDAHYQVSLSWDEQNKQKHPPKGKPSVSESKLESHKKHDGTDLMGSTDELLQHEMPNAFNKSHAVGAPPAQDCQSVGVDVSPKENIADMAASSDSTEEDKSLQTKRRRVAVRKIPIKRFRKASKNSEPEKPSLATSSTIFNDASDESSGDEFQTCKRKSNMREVSDNSTTSADSDEGLETQTTGARSAAYDKKDTGYDGGGVTLSQSSNRSTKSMPLHAILRSSSSYKKAKFLASQSQAEDSESQPIDVVPETQPELATP